MQMVMKGVVIQCKCFLRMWLFSVNADEECGQFSINEDEESGHQCK